MDDNEPSENERCLVENELVMQHVKSRLGRSQESEERLFAENVRLGQELKRRTQDFEDIREYMQLQIVQKTEQNDALEQTSSELRQTLDKANRDHEASEAALKSENAALKAELQKRTHEFQKKMKGAQEFVEEKERLQAELAALSKSTEETRRRQEKKLAEMERTHIQDREIWKRETAKKVKEAKAQMMQLTDNQLEMTTKRTILENEQMASELGYQSRQTEKMLHRSDMLLEENAELKIRAELAKETHDELAQRNLVYQRALQKLLERFATEKDLHQMARVCRESVETELRDQTAVSRELERRDVEQRRQIEGLQQRVGTLEQELKASETSKDDAVRFVKSCVKEIRQKTVEIARDRETCVPDSRPLVQQGEIEELSQNQRARALKYMLSQIPTSKATASAESAGGWQKGRKVQRGTTRDSEAFPDVVRKATENKQNCQRLKTRKNPAH